VWRASCGVSTLGPRSRQSLAAASAWRRTWRAEPNTPPSPPRIRCSTRQSRSTAGIGATSARSRPPSGPSRAGRGPRPWPGRRPPSAARSARRGAARRRRSPIAPGDRRAVHRGASRPRSATRSAWAGGARRASRSARRVDRRFAAGHCATVERAQRGQRDVDGGRGQGVAHKPVDETLHVAGLDLAQAQVPEHGQNSQAEVLLMRSAQSRVDIRKDPPALPPAPASSL
jgi:hypothetical protein